MANKGKRTNYPKSRKSIGPEHRADKARATRRRWATPELAADRLRAANRFKAGESFSAIARDIGRSKCFVIWACQRIYPAHVQEYRDRIQRDAETRRKRNRLIVLARAEGHTLDVIARVAGVSEGSVRNVLGNHRAAFEAADEEDR